MDAYIWFEYFLELSSLLERIFLNKSKGNINTNAKAKYKSTRSRQTYYMVLLMFSLSFGQFTESLCLLYQSSV